MSLPNAQVISVSNSSGAVFTWNVYMGNTIFALSILVFKFLDCFYQNYDYKMQCNIYAILII